MDLFRSKKRDNDFTSIPDIPSSLKKRRGHARSVDDILTAIEADTGNETATDNSLSCDSDAEDFIQASKKQKTLAKKSIKWEKKKEKEHKKKIEKNFISMDDFLSKQSEFKMWLYEEKQKNAGSLSSPKMKVFFKQFVRLWNKKKLLGKYYRGSDLQSPIPLTPKKCDFDGYPDPTDPLTTENKGQLANLKSEAGDEKESTNSPFITFGKTPPKVFRSKKMQLFGSSDIALISVAPLGSPKPSLKNKENAPAEPKAVNSHYQVPASPTKFPQVKPIKHKPETKDTDKETVTDVSAGPVTPYKVSVFPWAIDEDNTIDLDVCVTATPPNSSFGVKDADPAWPPPPTEEELTAVNGSKVKPVERVTKSPRVPPPPPPRSSPKKTVKNEYMTMPPVPSLALTYSDPYDKLPEKERKPPKPCTSSDYQEPMDCIQSVNSRTVPDDVNVVLKSLTSDQEDVSALYAKPVKAVGPTAASNLEELYAKPNKPKKSTTVGHGESNVKKCNEEIVETKELCSEVKVSKSEMDDCSKLSKGMPNPCLLDTKTTSATTKSPMGKKKGILAASTDKIYETYLNLGRHKNPFKPKSHKFAAVDSTRAVYANVLKKKFQSQPDISFSETDGVDGEVFEPFSSIGTREDNVVPSNLLYHSRFGKPLNASTSEQDITDKRSNGLYESIASQSRHIRKFLEGPCHEGPKYVQLSVAQSTDSAQTDCPGTPIIKATPSFESLCPVTPICQRSGSSQSLPCPSTSNENLSLSTSTEKSVSAESLPTATELKNRVEEVEGSRYNSSKECTKFNDSQLKQAPTSSSDNISDNLLAALNNGLIPMTPGKISAAKHGIDLSVYLLKQPPKQPACSLTADQPATAEATHEPEHQSHHVQKKIPPAVPQKPLKTSAAISAVSRVGENQSRLAIRETLSGVKTKLDSSKAGGKKEQVRRHTVQTVQEIKTLTTVPTIGIASKTRRLDGQISGNRTSHSLPRNKREVSQSSDESDTKRVCTENGKNKKSKSRKPASYLETDIDTDVPKMPPLKKSKSHSGFDLAPSTVVTDIW